MKNLKSIKICFVLFVIVSTLFAAPFRNGFENKVRLDIANGHLGTDTLTNFPILIKIGTNIPSFSYGDLYSANGDDLAFFDMDSETPLKHEVDLWNKNGISHIWVKIPILTNGHFIHLYYGSKFSTNNQPLTAQSKAAVWTGFLGVYHLGEKPSHNAIFSDSTIGNNGVLTDKNSDSLSVSGAIGKGLHFINDANEASDNYIKLGNSSEFNVNTFTVSFWAQGFPGVDDYYIEKKDVWSIGQRGTLQKLNFITKGVTGESLETPVSFPLMNNGNWHYISATFSSSYKAISINGIELVREIRTGSADNILSSLSSDVFIGSPSGLVNHFNGKIDEVRISTVQRSTIWEKASYDTVTKSDFISYSAVTNYEIIDIVLDGYYYAQPTNNEPITYKATLGHKTIGITNFSVSFGDGVTFLSNTPFVPVATINLPKTYAVAGTYKIVTSIAFSNGFSLRVTNTLSVLPKANFPFAFVSHSNIDAGIKLSFVLTNTANITALRILRNNKQIYSNSNLSISRFEDLRLQYNKTYNYSIDQMFGNTYLRTNLTVTTPPPVPKTTSSIGIEGGVLQNYFAKFIFPENSLKTATKLELSTVMDNYHTATSPYEMEAIVSISGLTKENQENQVIFSLPVISNIIKFNGPARQNLSAAIYATKLNIFGWSERERRWYLCPTVSGFSNNDLESYITLTSDTLLDFNIYGVSHSSEGELKSGLSTLTINNQIFIPGSEHTDARKITFSLNNLENLELELEVYSIDGVLVYKSPPVKFQNEISWDGRGTDGMLVDNDAYLYRLTINGSEQQTGIIITKR